MLVKEFLESHRDEDLEAVVYEPVADEEYIFSVKGDLLNAFGEYLVENVDQDDFGTYIMGVINPYTEAYTKAVDAYLEHHDTREMIESLRESINNDYINLSDARQIVEDIFNEF